MSPLLKVPGAKIKKLRRAAGKSQTELSKLVSEILRSPVSQSKISRYENDDHTDWSEPSLDALYRALNLDAATDLAASVWGLCPNFTCTMAFWDSTDGDVRAIPYAQKTSEGQPGACVHCQTALMTACPKCHAHVYPSQSGCSCGCLYVSEPGQVGFNDKVAEHNARRQAIADLKAYFEKNS